MIGSATTDAISLLFSGDGAVWATILRTLVVSGTSVLIATAVGIPLGYLIGAKRFAGRRLALVVVNTGMGLPPVVAGLIVFMLLSRTGPLGGLGIMFTVPAMIVAQVAIAAPLITGVTAAAIASVPVDMRLQARSLGASAWQEASLSLKEARRGVMAAVVAGFGGIISEVGAVMIVGGNIAGRTQTMTTAIVQETSEGHFGQALALGLILIGIAFVIMNGMTWLQQSGGRYER